MNTMEQAIQDLNDNIKALNSMIAQNTVEFFAMKNFLIQKGIIKEVEYLNYLCPLIQRRINNLNESVAASQGKGKLGLIEGLSILLETSNERLTELN